MPAYSLTASSVLSDDYIYTSDVLVDLTTASPVGVFSTQAGPNALFARADGVLCQLSPSPGTGAGGWSVSSVGATSGVTQAVAGTQQDGTVHGFYTDGSQLYHIAWNGATWSAPDTLPFCTGLQITNNFITGELIVYGVGTDGGLLFVRQGTSGTWGAASIAFPSSLAGTAPVLTLTSELCDWVMAVPGVASDGTGQLDLYQGTPTAMTSNVMPVPVADPVAAVVLGFWTSNSPLFLFTDTKNNLYTSVGTTGNVVRIPNVAVANASAILDLESNLHVYLVSPGGSVTVLHQTGWNDQTGPVWAPAIPLDGGFVRLFSDSNPLDAAAFFAVEPSGAIWHYQQDPTTNLWSSGKALTSGGATSYNVAQYRTEVVVRDENGNPVPNAALTVTASTTSSVVVKGTFFPVGPATAAQIVTNPLGRVTVSTIATDVSSPTLTFTAEDLTAATVNPAAGLHDYLRGAGTLHAGTSSALPDFGATTIRNAQVGGQPLAPATRDPNSGAQRAQTAADGITSMLQLKVAGGSGALAARGIVGFSVDFSDPERPAFRSFTDHHAFARERARVRAAVPGAIADSASDFWDSIKDFVEDLWEGIKNAAIAVTHFVVHVIDETVDLVVQIGDEIHHLADLVVKGLETVAAVVQGIFAAIGAFIEKLIAWLKMLLDFKAYAHTASALESALTQIFPYLQGVIQNDAEPLVDGFFSSLEGEVRSAFDAMIARYQNGETLATLAAPSPRRAFRAVPAAPATANVNGFLGQVQGNWLLEKIESYLGGGSFDTVGSLAQPLETLGSAFETTITDFENAVLDFAAFLQTAVTDPQGFSTLGIAEFLGAVKNVALGVLAFFDGIIEALLQVIAAALGAVDTILTKPLRIPFLSDLLDLIGSLIGIDFPSPSVASVFCFALAIPVTMSYKIANGAGSEPFPSGSLPAREAFLLEARSEASSAATACQYVASALAAIWALFDTGLDAVPDVSLLVFKVIDVVAPTLVQVFTWPGFVPFTAIALDTPAEKAGFANWIVGYVLVALDIALLVTSSVSWAEGSTMARYQDPVGKLLLTGCGALNLVTGIVASSLGGVTPGAIAANILAPLPVLTQFLRLESLEEASEGVTLALKLVIDFFAGEGFAVAVAAS